MKLSVIIPVYQVEATLNRCVESVIGQTFTDLEVILVDDGSPDSCPQKCDEWAEKDSRIHVIHKNNGGLSDARNAGLDVASGEFIAFVDSDDYLQNDTYQRVLPLATTCDIVEFPVYRFFGSTKQSMLLFDNSIYTDKAEYWLKHKAYEHTYAWNKCLRQVSLMVFVFQKDVSLRMHTSFRCYYNEPIRLATPIKDSIIIATTTKASQQKQKERN